MAEHSRSGERFFIFKLSHSLIFAFSHNRQLAWDADRRAFAKGARFGEAGLAQEVLS